MNVKVHILEQSKQEEALENVYSRNAEWVYASISSEGSSARFRDQSRFPVKDDPDLGTKF